MANNQTRVEFEPYFGGFVLETLTIGMYGEARNAIREYIQNGFDSIQRAIIELKILPAGDGLIEIELAEDRGSLTIRDNGAGLTTKTAADVLTRVGASSKSHRQKCRIPRHRAACGHRLQRHSHFHDKGQART